LAVGTDDADKRSRRQQGPRRAGEKPKLEPGVQVAETHSLHQAPEARKNVARAIGSEVEYHAPGAPQAMNPGAEPGPPGAGRPPSRPA